MKSEIYRQVDDSLTFRQLQNLTAQLANYQTDDPSTELQAELMAESRRFLTLRTKFDIPKQYNTLGNIGTMICAVAEVSRITQSTPDVIEDNLDTSLDAMHLMPSHDRPLTVVFSTQNDPIDFVDHPHDGLAAYGMRVADTIEPFCDDLWRPCGTRITLSQALGDLLMQSGVAARKRTRPLKSSEAVRLGLRGIEQRQEDVRLGMPSASSRFAAGSAGQPQSYRLLLAVEDSWHQHNQ